MKKIISIFLVFCLLFSVCGCKKAPSEDTAAPLDIVTDTPQEEDTTPETQTEQDPEQAPVQEQEIVQADKAEPEQSEQTPTPEPEPNPNKAAPCSLTLDNTFSKYEVIVTLTKDETDKNKQYTANDFPEADVFYVVEKEDYYGKQCIKDSYPEYQDKTTLFMYLNTPSKENVLKTVKILEADERVYAACPCPFNSSGSLKAYLTEEGKLKAKKYELALSDFDLENVVYADYSSGSGVVEFGFGERINENQDKTYTAFKKLVNNPYVTKAFPVYPDYSGNIQIIIDNSDYDPTVHTKETFEKLTDMTITKFKKGVDMKYNDFKEFFIYFEKPTYQQLFDMVSKVNDYDNNIEIFVNPGNLIIQPVDHLGDYFLE